MNTVDIVLGTFFGDEGKGNITQWRCLEALKANDHPLVCRFSGGPQAGHNVVHNNISHICSSYGAGVLLGVPTYLSENVYIDPICIYNEYKVLNDKGITHPKLYINSKCRIITPLDIIHNINDNTTLNNGSCGMGIYATFKRYNDTKITTSLDTINFEDYYKLVSSYYDIGNLNIDMAILSDAYELYQDATIWLLDNNDIEIVSTDSFDTLISDNNYKLVFEGSQGLLLDMERGYMPNCTPSKTGLNGISEKYLINANVYMPMRSYLTRHGNGYEPKSFDCMDEYFMELNEPTNKDDGYQGVFKRGLFDFNLLYDVINRHTLDNYKANYNCHFIPVITQLDKLYTDDEFPYIERGFSTYSVGFCNDIVTNIKECFVYNRLLSDINDNTFEIYGSFSNDSTKINRM